MNRFLLIHPDDDLVVALEDLPKGQLIDLGNGSPIVLTEPVPAKHKLARRSIAAGRSVKMYGMVVGEAIRSIRAGQPLSTANLRHAVAEIELPDRVASWTPPDISDWKATTFQGYHRADGRVGTRNYWLVVPLVFCQNRNIDVLREAMLRPLGYHRAHRFQAAAEQLLTQFQNGGTPDLLRSAPLQAVPENTTCRRPFPNVDGVKFLTHEGGCGGTYDDAKTLCGLLAGYINHPNVAGATVLSLGCQKSQIETLQAEIVQRNPDFQKPLVILDHQTEGREDQLLEKALRETLAGVAEANDLRREPAPLSQLMVGVECGGSDGFSGISANPAIGWCSDHVVALGGSVILSEFPELSGCESDLVARCRDPSVAEKFLSIMQAYEQRSLADGAGFGQNPSPGNIRDGLITDAMKSAGAALKGGRSPIVDVLDYPEAVNRPGLNLLCTPGGDVESTTAKAGAGATIQLFSTGLGTPTGNPISPVLKISSNTPLAQRMPDIIDINAGTIIDGESTIESVGAELLKRVVETASGGYRTHAERLGQDDFIPWKRGLSI